MGSHTTARPAPHIAPLLSPLLALPLAAVVLAAGCASTHPSPEPDVRASAEALYGRAVDTRNAAVALHNAAVAAERAGRTERAVHLYEAALFHDPDLPEPALAFLAAADEAEVRDRWEREARERTGRESARVVKWTRAFDGLEPIAPTDRAPVPEASAPHAFYLVLDRRPRPSGAKRRANPSARAPIRRPTGGALDVPGIATAPTAFATVATLTQAARAIHPRHRRRGGPPDDAWIVLAAHDRIVAKDGREGLMQRNREWAAAARAASD